MCRGAALAGRVLEEDNLVEASASCNHPGISNMRFLQCMKVAISCMTADDVASSPNAVARSLLGSGTPVKMDVLCAVNHSLATAIAMS